MAWALVWRRPRPKPCSAASSAAARTLEQRPAGRPAGTHARSMRSSASRCGASGGARHAWTARQGGAHHEREGPPGHTLYRYPAVVRNRQEALKPKPRHPGIGRAERREREKLSRLSTGHSPVSSVRTPTHSHARLTVNESGRDYDKSTGTELVYGPHGHLGSWGAAVGRRWLSSRPSYEFAHSSRPRRTAGLTVPMK